MSVFRFKEFVVDQENCPMKINTDGVLLGALTEFSQGNTILDIGTGTGVIALMMAQRFPEAFIDAVDIDFHASEKAAFNFEQSLFHQRLKVHHHSFQEFFMLNPTARFDLIITNPPFFINSLKSDKDKKNISRHTSEQLFIDLVHFSAMHLNDCGKLSLIIPVDLQEFMINLASDYHLCLEKNIEIKSYSYQSPFRNILEFSREPKEIHTREFIIYEEQGINTLEYKNALKDFFLNFT